ncbi:MAG: hypothetical protein KAH35_02805 [Candidatus Atribacteria bacterium]|nr:hypothetical protein [Candidatus Atribacteria bacterium]
MGNFDGDNAIIFGLVLYGNASVVPMGSLYDAIEYFLTIYESNKDIKLLFHLVPQSGYIDYNSIYKHLTPKFDYILKQIRDIIDSRYYVSDFCFFDNIYIVNLVDLFLGSSLNKILTVDLTTPKKFKENFARAKEIFIIPELTKSEYFYQSKRNKVTYFTEMPFCHCDVPYKMKFDFERCKPIDTFDEKLYVNYPRNNPYKDVKVSSEIDKFNKDVMIKEDKFHYNLHPLFDEDVYFQSTMWFDPHPKLFHECKFYGKPYHYFNFNRFIQKKKIKQFDASFSKKNGINYTCSHHSSRIDFSRR